MRVYCFDTSVMFHWSMKSSSSHDKAMSLFRRLKSEDSIFVLPSPALAEFLVLFADNKQTMYQVEHELCKTFQIKSFDMKCATLAAEIFNLEKEAGNIEAGLKQKIKVDTQIVSIAKASNCDQFYVEDDKLLALAARHGVKSSRLPKPDPSQVKLDF